MIIFYCILLCGSCRDVVEAVDEETMVLVFGDHGMTSTGDHGGETELETHAALLVYSKQQLFHYHQVRT